MAVQFGNKFWWLWKRGKIQSSWDGRTFLKRALGGLVRVGPEDTGVE